MVGAAADIQEVSRFPPGKPDHIHGCHCKTGAVGEASHVPVKPHVAYTRYPRLLLQRFFCFSERSELMVPEHGAVIDGYLGIEGNKPATGKGKRVDLY